MKENQQKQEFFSPAQTVITFWNRTVVCASFTGVTADDVDQVNPDDYVSF